MKHLNYLLLKVKPVKPHIACIRPKNMPEQLFWCCEGPPGEWGLGRTPKEAYTAWARKTLVRMLHCDKP